MMGLLFLHPSLAAQDSQDNQPRVEPRSGTSTPSSAKAKHPNPELQQSEQQQPEKQQPEQAERPSQAPAQAAEQGDSSSKDSQVDFNSTSRTDLPKPSVPDADDNVFRPWDPHRAAKDVEVGEYYLKQKNYRAALERFNDALLYKPNDADATFDLAVTQEKLDLFDKALRSYSKYLEIAPGGPKAKECQEAFKRLSARGETASATDAAAKKAAEDMDVGETFLAKNSFDAAREHFEEALRLSPDNPRACFRLAQSLQGLERPEAARLYYQKYLELEPKGPYAADARKAIAEITYLVGK
jgi:tetratricopeptide (TPR) repeat protein